MHSKAYQLGQQHHSSDDPDLQVCMKCGEYESGLNTPCKKVNNVSE